MNFNASILALIGMGLVAGCTTSPAPPVTGSASEAASTPMHASLDYPFVARGQEPGWILTLTASRLELKARYGEVAFGTERPEPEVVSEEKLSYSVTTDQHDLTAVIEPQLCHDSMSGLPHPYRVDIQLDGDTYSGCGGEPRELVVGRTWRVTEFAGQPVASNRMVTLTFDREGTLTGQAPCNRYWSIYEITGGGMNLKHDSTTERACAAEVMNREKRFLDLLQQTRTFWMTDTGTLVLEASDGDRLKAVQLAQDSG